MFLGTCDSAGADGAFRSLALPGSVAGDRQRVYPETVGPDVETMRRLGQQSFASAFYREAMLYLEGLSHCVSEGKRLDEANDFCRFLLNSRICDLLRPFDSTGALKVDSAHLGWMAEDLRRAVCEQFRSGKVIPVDHGGTLKAINSKLDLIAGHLARLPL